ncbi:MAG: META domain-containing protein [Bacteroidia bacterium]|nr:META domain-containing protein [Bacteroidia bacterium]
MKLVLVVSAALAACGFGACSPKLTTDTLLPADTLSLQGTWHLVALSGTPLTEQDTLRGVPELTFRFAEGRYGGTTGCNRMGGPISWGPKGRVSFGAGFSTKIACPGTLEARLHQALRTVTHYRLRGDELLLLDSKGALLRYLRHTP